MIDFSFIIDENITNFLEEVEWKLDTNEMLLPENQGEFLDELNDLLEEFVRRMFQ